MKIIQSYLISAEGDKIFVNLTIYRKKTCLSLVSFLDLTTKEMNLLFYFLLSKFYGGYKFSNPGLGCTRIDSI